MKIILARSRLFVPGAGTFESPSGLVSFSHQMMTRGGFLRRSGHGIFSLLPLGTMALGRLTDLVCEELGGIGAQRLEMPLLVPGELWRETGRWDSAGPELFRLKDRAGRDHLLAATSEETVTEIVRAASLSHRQFPLLLFQVGRKYRDEARPRAGLLRGREFVMKDMYSFDVTLEGARETYELVRGAYERIFDRLGLKVVQVQADVGNIGGISSHEFHLTAVDGVGEDVLLTCESCGHSANVETTRYSPSEAEARPLREAWAAAGRNAPGLESHVVEAVRYTQDGAKKDRQVVVVVSPAGRTPSLPKLRRLLGADEANLLPAAAEPEAGTARVLADASLGGTDELLAARAGDPCPCCHVPASPAAGHLAETRGIELGHVFLLGTKYSQAMGATVRLPGEPRPQPLQMGCFGIGMTRVLAACVEANKRGEASFVWPVQIAPFPVAVIDLTGSAGSAVAATQVAEVAAKVVRPGKVLVDDTAFGAGHKFKDAELLGHPILVVVGKTFENTGQVEVIDRRPAQGKQTHHVTLQDLPALLQRLTATSDPPKR